MYSSGFGLLPLTMWIAMLGLPLGVPPQPEDPMMAKIAPEQCLFYLSSAGVAEPKATSDNQLEQLLAEPEVRQMSTDVERLIDQALAQVVQQPGGLAGLSADEAAILAKLFLSCPKAVYLADLKVQRNGPPQIRAGALLGLGDSAEKVKSLLADKLGNVPVQKSESDGATWYQFQPAPDAPLFKFGVKDRYLVLAIGEGEAEAMQKRTEGKAPAWFNVIGRELPIGRGLPERRSMVEYVNVAKLREILLAAADDPHVATYTEALGLNNVTAIYSAAGLDRTDFLSRTLVAIDGEPHGIFRAANGKPLTPGDVKSLPADATFAAAMRLDPQQIWDIFLSIAEKTDPSAKAGIRTGMGELQDVLGMKMPDDLLAPFGDTVCLYDSPSEGGLGLGLTATLKVKDAAKAKAAFDKVMVFLKMKMNTAAARQKAVPQPVAADLITRPRIETLQIAGTEIYVLNPRPSAFVAFSWCLTDEELIFSLYPQSIKARLTRGARFQSLADLPEAQKLLDGENRPFAAGYCDTRRLFDYCYPMLLIMGQSVSTELQRRQGIDVNVSILPSAGAIRRHLTPELLTLQRTKSGIEFADRGALPGMGLATAAPMAAIAVIPARMAAQGAAFRVQSMNNMKQIGLAMHVYNEAYKTFPPAFKADKDGKPLLSWRVLILPYLEQDTLYRQFHLDEPWDSEHNKALLDKMPNFYRSPGSKAGAGMTNYLTVRGEKAIYHGSKGARFAEIVDGSSHTITLVEASDEKAVPWTKPDDFDYDEKDPIKGLVGLQNNGFLALMADGSVRVIGNSIKPSVLNALFTRNGNEPVDWDQIP
jgi:hypothetical protein